MALSFEADHAAPTPAPTPTPALVRTLRTAPARPGMRLGDLLVERGILSPEQRDEILEVQRASPRPFGLLAEELFGVCPRDVEQAWAHQYASLAHWEDPTHAAPPEPVRGLVDRRQAWQFAVVPLRMEDGEAVLATTTRYLARAMRFAGWRMSTPHRFVLCGESELHTALDRVYPMGRVDRSAVEAGGQALAQPA